jgi:uncharacterized protein DUF5996
MIARCDGQQDGRGRRLSDWPATRDTMHMWTQIIGKVRMAHAPLDNHWWQATLYVTARADHLGDQYAGGAFDFEFYFVDHQLRIRTSDVGGRAVAPASKPVAQFYAETTNPLRELGIRTHIRGHAQGGEPAVAAVFSESRSSDLRLDYQDGRRRTVAALGILRFRAPAPIAR